MEGKGGLIFCLLHVRPFVSQGIKVAVDSLSTLFTAEPVSLQLDYVFFMISGRREMQLFMKSALTMPAVYGNLLLFLLS